MNENIPSGLELIQQATRERERSRALVLNSQRLVEERLFSIRSLALLISKRLNYTTLATKEFDTKRRQAMRLKLAQAIELTQQRSDQAHHCLKRLEKCQSQETIRQLNQIQGELGSLVVELNNLNTLCA